MKRAIVIRLDHLGDLLLTTPLIRALALDGYTVDAAVPRHWTPILQHNPHLAETFDIESIAPDFPRPWLPLADWLRRRHYHVIILPYAHPRPLLWASALSGIPRRIAMWGGAWARLTGHQSLRSRILTHPRPYPDIILDCARALGCPPQGLHPEYHVTPEESRTARQWLASNCGNAPVVGIHPGSAGNACNPAPEFYAQVARSLLDHTDASLLITGVPSENALLAAWPAEVLRSPRVHNLMGQLHLRQLATLLSHLKAYVVSSTGTLHLAAAVRCPTLSPFCHLSPLSSDIWGNSAGTGQVILPPVSHCRQQRCHKNSPPCSFPGVLNPDDFVRHLQSIL